MTRVTIFRKGGRAVGFEADGHTGYACEGEDIVCAAVSALTQTAILGATRYLKIKGACDISDGYLYFMLPDNISDDAWRGAEIILETMAIGLKDIAETNDDYIKMIEREV